jgi:hypothetical protein
VKDPTAQLAVLARAVDTLANALTDVREQINAAMGSTAPSNDDDDDDVLRAMAVATAAQLRRRRRAGNRGGR